MNKKLLTGSTLLILAAFFIVLTVISNNLFKSSRIDLTENNLYTLSDGAKNVISKIPEPLNLYFFFSDKVTQGIPQLQSYGTRVRELLEEFANNADGNINLQVIDPEPFSEQEDQATSYGLQGQPFGRSGDKLYFGLAGSNAIGTTEIIPFFQREREQFLEYDIAKMVYNLSHPKKKVLGLISTIALEGGFDQQQGQTPPLVIHNYLSQLFEIRNIAIDKTFIDDDVDVLMIVHPQNLSEDLQFAIDQFVLAGGNALVLVDPIAESQQPQQGQFEIPDRASNLDALFSAWGVNLDTTKIVGDMTYALPVQARGAGAVSHPNYLALDENVINRDEAITSELDMVTIGMAGHLIATEGATTNFVPLLQTSEKSMLYDAARFNSFAPPQPQDLLRSFSSANEQYTVAARVSGKISTAFPEGNPAADAADEGVLTESAGDINVIVIADTDILQNNLWVRVQRLFGQQLASPWADNGDFIINAVDTLMGNNDLISIRSRGEFSRPFERVIEIQRQAELKFHEKEEQLQTELEETEKELSQLQASKDGDGQFILSPEQAATIEKFREKQVQIRKQLREVRHALDKDIENLGSNLKAINIGLVPLLLVLLALGMAYVRIQRRNKG